MKQIDWIKELEEKKKRWYYRKHLREKASKIRSINIMCEICRRDIVFEVDLDTVGDITDELRCICGKVYPVGAQIVNWWTGPYVKERFTTA